MTIREKRHRLPREYYQGEVSVAVTLCMRNREHVFTEPQLVDIFTGMLSDAAGKAACSVPAYCFMPDHHHILITGMQQGSDVWKAVVNYKQRTGYWLSVHMPGVEWQKDFYDHVIKTPAELAVRARYILDNPVRKGLVQKWQEYPFKGSIGCALDDVLNSLM